MVTPRDLARQDTARKDTKTIKNARRNGGEQTVKRNPHRGKIRNQPLKGNPELFRLKNELEKENGK